MATVLFTWELGGGLGHMMPILSLAREVRQRGHQVFVALRDLSRARGVFGDDLVTLLQAPAKVGPPANAFRPPYTLAHILHNVGYSDSNELAGLVAAWRGLFVAVKPDVILFDHSPTALLASRGLKLARIPTGLGFCCPPDQHPLPNLRSWTSPDLRGLEQDEQRVLGRMNEVMDIAHAPRLSRIGELYSDVDDTFLLTFKELDHYENRPGEMRYRGAWVPSGGKTPQWPSGSGKKIYAYLKNFSALPHVLAALKNLKSPTLIFVDGVDPKIQAQFVSPHLAFDQTRFDIQAVAAECDVAVLNGNHGTAVALLRAGKPMVQLPMYLEQGMSAAAINRLGAGLQVDLAKPQQIPIALRRLLEEPQFQRAAQAFASRYADFDMTVENEQMVGRIEELISGNP